MDGGSDPLEAAVRDCCPSAWAAHLVAAALDDVHKNVRRESIWLRLRLSQSPATICHPDFRIRHAAAPSS
jgi:hypothetical protein